MKKSVLKLGLCALLATHLVAGNEMIPGFVGVSVAAEVAKAEKKEEAMQIKGKITNISQKAKTIALAKKDKSFFLLKFNDETELKGVKSSKEFKVGEAIVVHYKVAGGENIATTLQKALVKLPKGVKEVKTEELAKLISQDNIVLVDARPPIRYAESHIAGAVSIPFSKVVKKGEEGNTLFEKYKDKQLVFYCGGPT